MSDYFQIDDRCVVQPGRDGDSGVCVDVEVEASWGLGWHGKHVFFLWYSSSSASSATLASLCSLYRLRMGWDL